MRILRNYLLLECIIPFLLALSVLTCVFLLGNLVQLANLVVNKGVSLWTIIQIFFLYIPVLLGYTLPLACLAGAIMALSRLSIDNEIIALRACGIHLRRLLTPLAAVGIVLSLVLFILTDRVIPYAHHQQRVMLKTLGSKNPTALLEPGVFINSFEKQVIFIHRIVENKMYNVTIYQPQPDGKPTRTIIANRGEFTPVPGQDKVLLKLMNGVSDEQDAKNPGTIYKLNFDNFFMTLNLSSDQKKINKKPKSMSLRELQEEKNRLDQLLVDTTQLETEYFRNISWSLSPLVFILLGFPLAVVTNKRAKTANIFAAVAFAAGYYMLFLGCEALALRKVGPPALLLWIPNILGVIIAGYFNLKLFRS